MFNNKALGIVVIGFLGSHGANAQQVQPALAAVKSIKCIFPIFATGTLRNGTPEAAVKPASLSLEFESINVDEGTALLPANVGGTASKSDILVRLSKGTLHFIQLFLDGALYTTTIFPNETRNGMFQAVHTRHEFTPGMSLPGFTWQPEQYYGECQVQE